MVVSVYGKGADLCETLKIGLERRTVSMLQVLLNSPTSGTVWLEELAREWERYEASTVSNRSFTR